MDPQQWLAMQALYLNGGNSPYLYPTGPAPDPTAPELSPYAQYLYGTMAPPNTNKAGELLPYNLDYAKSLTNFQQDVNQVIADPLNAYISGVMGGEGFAPGVFDQVAKESPITFTQTPMLQAMAAAGGYQGTLAKMMLPKEFGGSGMNPGTAVATLQKAVANPDDAAKLGVDVNMLEQIKGELPQVFDTMTMRPVEGQYNWQDVTKTAEGLFTPMVQEQATIFNPDRSLRSDVIQKDNGQFYSQEMVDSPQLEWLKKMGLPDPNARYDVQYAMQNDPAIAGLFQHSAETMDQAESMRKTFDAYTKKIAKQREAAARAREEDARALAKYQQGPLREWAGKMEPYAAGVRQSMSDYFREAGQGAPDTIRIPGSLVAPGQPGYQPFGEQQAGGLSMAKPVYTHPRGTGPDLPDFAWPGAAPEAPQLSPASRMTPDEVAQLFNQASGLLPKAFRPQAMAVNAERPMRQAALKASRAAEFQAGVPALKALTRYLALNAAGRTPAKDVVQQRLLPMYASGAMGQQGLPTAYPNRNAVLAAYGG